MRTKRFWFLLVLPLMVSWALAQEAGEAAKIGYLIESVASLSGAAFIRNGTEYDARQAADHLRLKLRAAGDPVKTAEDFIRYCGSKSSVSGQPYRIRFSDGTSMTAEAFFRKQLKAYAAPKSP